MPSVLDMGPRARARRAHTHAWAAFASVSGGTANATGGRMSEHRPVHEKPRVEEHKVYALLAIPVFLVTVFIIALIAILGTSPRP